MANRIINIGRTASDDIIDDEIYRDVNMISKINRNVTSQGADYRYQVDKLVNVRAVQNSLDNIFTWIKGERVLDPEFGSDLRKLLYQGINQFTEEQIVAEIKGCIARYEPRVNVLRVINVSSVSETEDNTIRLDIEYTINGLEDVKYHYNYEYVKVV